ncbi:class I SAM-dependent methyltransferase [Actinorhabdospora filicis]|nr:class I SAM-dependent methyltransferase [Actinorhabdospora filicis]
MRNFEELIAEGESVPVEGWDFSWFAGRATEQRPSWGYARLIGERMARAAAGLDVQTGGGEVLATIPQPPPLLAATESWEPNLAVARRNLAPLGASVHHVGNEDALPFDDGTFDLVVSRHPVVTRFDEVARVLAPGGSYLSQQVGMGSMHELTAAMIGEFADNEARSPERIAGEAEAAGLEVVDLRPEALRAEFFDVGAVVVFLRKVIWTVPEFSVARYRPQLLALHERIEAEGPFTATTRRFLIEARKP